VKIAAYRYLVTLIVVAVAGGVAWSLYQKYVTDPWTCDCQVRANVVGIAPRVSGPIINIPVHDNQEVKAGDLLFEIERHRIGDDLNLPIVEPKAPVQSRRFFLACVGVRQENLACG
jgi:multidrug resistance efflux pump